MKIILYMIGRIFSYLLPSKLLNIIKIGMTYLRSGYYSRGFLSFGTNTIIGKSCYFAEKEYIQVGSNCSILNNCVITAISKWGGENFSPCITIHDNVNIGNNCHISAIDEISIGAGTCLGSRITIVDNSHGKSDGVQSHIQPYKRDLYSKGPVIIKENVWIGDGAVILPNVSIGKGAIIGSNAVVTKNIPDFGIAVGRPASIIGYNKK